MIATVLISSSSIFATDHDIPVTRIVVPQTCECPSHDYSENETESHIDTCNQSICND